MKATKTTPGRRPAGWRWLGLLPAAVAFTACGGGSPADSLAGTDPVSAQVNAKVLPCRFDHLYLTVQGIGLRQSGGAGEKTLETPLPAPRRLDLMNLGGGGLLQALGAAPLAAGNYAEVRLLLVPGPADGSLASAVPQGGGSAVELAVPGGAQASLRLKGDFQVTAGQTADLALAPAQVCASIRQAGKSGHYQFKPAFAAQLQVVSSDQERQLQVSLSALPGGGYLTLRRDLPAALYLQRHDAQGWPAGAETRIALSTIPGGYLNSVTALAGGAYVLTWLGQSPDPWARWDASYPLVVQRYGADGSLLGAEQAAVTQPSATRFPPAIVPQVAALADGGYVLAWAQYADSAYRLYARRYGANGVPARPAQMVAGDAVGPMSLVASADAGYFIAWGYRTLYARAYGPDDAALGPARTLGTRVDWSSLPEDQRTGLAALAGGGAVLTWGTWGSLRPPSGIYIHARRLAADGSPTGEAFLVDGRGLPGMGIEPQAMSSVAGLPDGGYVVAWLAPGGAVYGRRFAAAGSPLGSAARLNTAPANELGPTVVATANGGFAVTWQGPLIYGVAPTLHGRFFDASGLIAAP